MLEKCKTTATLDGLRSYGGLPPVVAERLSTQFGQLDTHTLSSMHKRIEGRWLMLQWVAGAPRTGRLVICRVDETCTLYGPKEGWSLPASKELRKAIEATLLDGTL